MKYNQNNILRNLTFGFEIEGAFHYNLINRIRKRGADFTTDGSVDNVEDLIGRNEEGEFCEDYQEARCGVYRSLAKCLEDLRLFNQQYYRWNKTCGLHLHIGFKQKMLRLLLTDYHFLRKLLIFLKNDTCFCVAERINNGEYCYDYPRNMLKFFEHWRRGFEGGEYKYRAIRNHPFRTFEIRAFAPCHHREANIQKVVGHILREATKIKTTKSRNIEMVGDNFVKSSFLY